MVELLGLDGHFADRRSAGDAQEAEGFVELLGPESGPHVLRCRLDFAECLDQRPGVASGIDEAHAKDLLKSLSLGAGDREKSTECRTGRACLNADVSECTEDRGCFLDAHVKVGRDWAGILESFAELLDRVESLVRRRCENVRDSRTIGRFHSELADRRGHDASGESGIGASGPSEIEDRAGHVVDLVRREASAAQLGHQIRDFESGEARRTAELESGVLQHLKLC